MNPFDFVNSINTTKKNLIDDDPECEKMYNAFLTNRSLSYFRDTVHIANVVNVNHQIDSKLQYDFLLNIVRKQKRFSKWNKPEVIDDLEAVKEYYGYSNEKARSALSILSPDHLAEIRKRISKGGKQ